MDDFLACEAPFIVGIFTNAVSDNGGAANAATSRGKQALSNVTGFLKTCFQVSA